MIRDLLGGPFPWLTVGAGCLYLAGLALAAWIGGVL